MGHWVQKGKKKLGRGAGSGAEEWQFEKQPLERDKARDEAMSFLRADYYTDVRHVGEQMIEYVKDGEVTDREGFSDRLHEELDGNRRVFVTFLAKLGLAASDNEDAAEEEGIETEGPEQQMYFAMQADVHEWLRANDFDPDDDDSYGGGDEEDDDDAEENPDDLYGKRDVGVYAESAGGHRHARRVLSDLVKDMNPDLAKELRGEMSDDASEEDEAIELLNEHTEEGYSWQFYEGELVLAADEDFE